MLIGKDWKVETDQMNVTLYRRTVADPDNPLTKTAGAERWVAVGYFSSVKHALHAMVERGIRDTGLVDLKVLDIKIDVLHQDIERLFESLQRSTGQSKSQKGILVPVGGEEV
jgi:hypothetical protein